MWLWNFFLLKFLWDSHNDHQAWLQERPSSTIGALIRIPFLLLEFAFRLVILGPLCIFCLSLVWFLIAPASFNALIDWLGHKSTQETIAKNKPTDTDASASVSHTDSSEGIASHTPNIDQLERMYGAEAQYNYVSKVWGTQLPQITASDARRIITDRALSDADYVVVLPRDDSPGHIVLVDKQENPILALYKPPDEPTSETDPTIDTTDPTDTEAIYTTPTNSSVPGDTLNPPANLPSDVAVVIKMWVDTANSGDIQKHSTLYAEKVDYFYTKQDLSRADIEPELKAMYGRYTEISISQLSNWSWDQIEPDVIRVTFDKHFVGTSSIATMPKMKREGSVRSQLVLRKFDRDWRIICELDLEIYSLSR